MQLYLLGICTEEQVMSQINIVSEYLSLKFNNKFKRNRAFFRRWRGKRLIESWELILTDEEFSSYVESEMSKSSIKWFSFGKRIVRNKDSPS